MWLQAYSTNSNAKIIAIYFLIFPHYNVIVSLNNNLLLRYLVKLAHLKVKLWCKNMKVLRYNVILNAEPHK